MLIDIKAVSKIYSMGNNSVYALDNVDFSVQRGEFVAIMGASGSGKSTLMNIIGCLDRPDRGSFTFNEIDVTASSDKELSAIRNKKNGFVFQSCNLIPHLNVLENVEVPLFYRGLLIEHRRTLALEALVSVGLQKRVEHMPDELSGGECQRVSIARAMAGSPDVLLADEPTGNLDSKTGMNIMELFRELHHRGNTIVMVTHDITVAEYADRIIVLKDGRIHEH
ncbi:ABC transporter ATP-binding protein [bacterium]|nr:ABC transporter ATP-binding protein [bacterium]